MILCEKCKSINTVRLDNNGWDEYLCRDCKHITETNTLADIKSWEIEYEIVMLRKELGDLKKQLNNIEKILDKWIID